MTETLRIEEWTSDHPRWVELLDVVESQQQAAWVAAAHPWHRGSYLLVAQQSGAIVGFLRFVTQVIGEDDDLEPVTLDGEPLIEAKVLAFGVVPTQRRIGVGRALQERAVAMADQLGCYQLRSHSSGLHQANHQLKLAMGFGIHPIVRGDDRRGAYFIMPLRTAR
jgi:GNAT superfamily N-acetyltransferase